MGTSHTTIDPNQPGRGPQPELISREMSSCQIASLLAQRGIRDITDELDFGRQSAQPLATGGFGSVYRGELLDGRPVAIKYIKMRDSNELESSGKHCKDAAHELYTWSKCDHPRILKILGFALLEESILLVSPLMHNGSLVDNLQFKSPSERLKFCIELAETVEYLHANGIVHGDIKAANVLVSENFEVHLADFGNATLVEYRTLLFTQTSPRLACSTRFAAPEILDESSEKHTAKSDIYALGMTILQILTGKLPYADYSDFGALANVFRKIPPPRPTFNDIFRSRSTKDKLWNLLLCCWEHDQSLRPTATEVKQALIGIKQELCI